MKVADTSRRQVTWGKQKSYSQFKRGKPLRLFHQLPQLSAKTMLKKILLSDFSEKQGFKVGSTISPQVETNTYIPFLPRPEKLTVSKAEPGRGKEEQKCLRNVSSRVKSRENQS
jgi:hypothetical protein